MKRHLVGTWHRGRQIRLPVSDPAVGQAWSSDIPDENLEDVWYQPLSVIYTFTTSAIAVNRGQALVYATGQAVFMRAPVSSVQIASSSIKFDFMVDSTGAIVTDATGAGFRTNFLPREVLVKGGDRIAVETLSMDPGDKFTDISLLLQEWVYEAPASVERGEPGRRRP